MELSKIPGWSKYCHVCGAPLIHTEIGRAKEGGAIYHVSCPNCGFENKAWNSSVVSSTSVAAVLSDMNEKPPDMSTRQWAEFRRDRRLNEMSLSEKIQCLTVPAFVFPALRPQLLLSSYWFGEGIKRIGLPASPRQKIRVLTNIVREGLRKGENRAIRMNDVLRTHYLQREEGIRYVEFHANYEGPEYDAAIEKIRIETHDRRAPRGFGKTTTIYDTIRWQLINFVPFGPPGTFPRDFLNERNKYLNLLSIQNAPVTRIGTSLRSAESARWEIRRLAFPAPLAYAYALIGDSELMIEAVGPIADNLEALLPMLVRLEPESSEADMLAEGRAAFARHRLKKAEERREQQR